MVNIVEKLSPLNELALPKVGGDAVTLSERLCDALVQVQAWPDTIADVEQVLQGIRQNSTVMQSGPGRWLVESEDENLETKLRRKIKSPKGAVTGLTHARVVVTIEGPKAGWVLASGIALDFSVEQFPVGSTRLSHHHEIGLTIHRPGADKFDLYVFTSLSRAFWSWIERASAEVGYSVS